MENKNKCPGCSQHCDRNNLQCGKGEAFFNGEANHFHSSDGKYPGRHGGPHKHHRPEFPAGSLADLMAKCGHRLFHSGDEAMFSALTDEEKAALKDLLSKLLAN